MILPIEDLSSHSDTRSLGGRRVVHRTDSGRQQDCSNLEAENGHVATMYIYLAKTYVLICIRIPLGRHLL